MSRRNAYSQPLLVFDSLRKVLPISRLIAVSQWYMASPTELPQFSQTNENSTQSGKWSDTLYEMDCLVKRCSVYM